MATSPLPVRLRYLEPVREQLLALRPEEIHEYTDLSALQRAVRKRVSGLPQNEARALLKEDGAELLQWLSQGQAGSDPLYFLVPFLGMEGFDALLKDPDQKAPTYEVQMDLPSGAKVEKGVGADGIYWEVKWGRLDLGVNPVRPQILSQLRQGFLAEQTRRPLLDGDGITMVEVRFEAVVGTKCADVGTERGYSKRVEYTLDVPGGQVYAVSGPKPFFFDETKWEAYFHTLRVVSTEQSRTGP